LIPAMQAQWPWKLEPLPEGAGDDKPPTEDEGTRPKGKKARKGKKGAVTKEALQAAVAQTAIERALAWELAVTAPVPMEHERLPSALEAQQAAGGG
jgi:hypothetical protein